MLAEQKQAAEDSYAMDEDTIYEVCTRIDKDEDSADIPVVVTSDSAVKQHNWAWASSQWRKKAIYVK